MRTRSTRPHFWRSKRIASVSWDARLVLKGLESYCDDNGVGKDDIALIVGDLFPRDLIREPSRTVARVTEAISELLQAGLLWRYAAEGASLLYIAFWEEVQRIDKAQAGRFPRPDGTLNYKDSSIRESSNTPREDSRTFAPGVGEEGSRGVGQKELAAQAPPKPKPARGQHLPDDWRPSDATTAWARQKYPHIDLRAEFEKFTNHWHSASGQNARKRNWDMAFKNWLMNSRQLKAVVNGSVATSDLRVAQVQALKDPDRTELE